MAIFRFLTIVVLFISTDDNCHFLALSVSTKTFPDAFPTRVILVHELFSCAESIMIIYESIACVQRMSVSIYIGSS